MGRKLLLLNLLMVAAIVLLAQQLVASWSAFQSEPRVFAPPGDLAPTQAVADPEQTAPFGDFMVITERNLFSENRGQEPLQAEVAVEEEPPELAKLPELISISAIRGEKQAVLTIFSGRRGRETENQTVKLGDDVEGYEVSEIGRDHLILRWRDVEEMIELSRSQNASERRPAQSSQAIRIITVGTAMAAVETTTTSEGAEETERGLQVGSVGGDTQGAGVGRRGGAAGLQGRGAGSRGGLAGRGNSQLNNRNNSRGLPGTVGAGGTRRPPVQSTPPPR